MKQISLDDLTSPWRRSFALHNRRMTNTAHMALPKMAHVKRRSLSHFFRYAYLAAKRMNEMYTDTQYT